MSAFIVFAVKDMHHPVREGRDLVISQDGHSLLPLQSGGKVCRAGLSTLGSHRPVLLLQCCPGGNGLSGSHRPVESRSL